MIRVPRMGNLLNYTPHELRIMNKEGVCFSIPQSGTVVYVLEENTYVAEVRGKRLCVYPVTTKVLNHEGMERLLGIPPGWIGIVTPKVFRVAEEDSVLRQCLAGRIATYKDSKIDGSVLVIKDEDIVVL